MRAVCEDFAGSLPSPLPLDTLSLFKGNHRWGKRIDPNADISVGRPSYAEAVSITTAISADDERLVNLGEQRQGQIDVNNMDDTASSTWASRQDLQLVCSRVLALAAEVGEIQSLQHKQAEQQAIQARRCGEGLGELRSQQRRCQDEMRQHQEELRDFAQRFDLMEAQRRKDRDHCITLLGLDDSVTDRNESDSEPEVNHGDDLAAQVADIADTSISSPEATVQPGVTDWEGDVAMKYMDDE